MDAIKDINFEPILKFSILWTEVLPPYTPEPSAGHGGLSQNFNTADAGKGEGGSLVNANILLLALGSGVGA